MASGWYECLRTVKKRRGYHSEADIHSYSCYLDDSEYYGSYNLRTIKDIYISETKTYYVNSYEVYFISKGNGQKYVMDGYVMRQSTKVQFVPDPTISINNDLGVIGDTCSINYRISDSDPTVRFKIVHKLNGVVIEEKDNTTDSNYTINLTDEHLSELSFNSTNNITIELNNTNGSRILDKTVTFTKGNTKPKLNVVSYNSTSATFTATDADNNLSKIEWYLDDVLKETITTDLTAEKTINYELTDNAIHTLKIVATDAENSTVEKVLSISKEIIPLQSDASLSDISAKLIEIGEGFRNGKTSIINTLALKNIEASLNNTLVELSEKIKTSFDSSDASVQELQNRITELTNQLSQRVKWASGTYITSEKTNTPFEVPINLNFVPKIVIVTNSTFIDSSSPILSIEGGSISNLSNRHFNVTWLGSTRIASGITTIEKITASSFTISCGSTNSAVNFPIYLNKGVPVKWYAFDEI
ncbi:Uncharacterised protein [Clostridioides difficile]|uniref:hypothetical protein n=1 Tax=Clostridioides difficile TaxID=1496 RepID=UPI00097FE9EC|nr:hypothetical protein [Clostridioides difficile]SJT80996.1 Uncharacterised protein [Clostridioides difficile]